MAKLALINKQKRREVLVAKYAKKREAIKEKMSVNATPDERMDAMKKLAKLISGQKTFIIDYSKIILKKKKKNY